MVSSSQELADKLNRDLVSPTKVNTTSVEHPEGAKRGGWLQVYEEDGFTVTWDDLQEEWVADDDDDEDQE